MKYRLCKTECKCEVGLLSCQLGWWGSSYATDCLGFGLVSADSVVIHAVAALAMATILALLLPCFAFAFAFAFAVTLREKILWAYYCLRICKTFKSDFDILKTWEDKTLFLVLAVLMTVLLAMR